MINKSIQQILNELADSETLMAISGNINKYYVPYMMNDAVECYLELFECQVTGTKKDEKIVSGEIVEGKGIIFTQESGNIFTVWFKDYKLNCDYYRFDKIGHFWRQGEEHLRRLNYIIGTIYDKYLYLGEESCNANEKVLMTLLGFRPLRYYSPIDEEFDIFYDEEDLEKIELSGISNMIQFAKKAGCRDYLRELERYEKCVVKGRGSFFNRKEIKKIELKLSNMLLEDNTLPLYYLLIDELDKAIREYPERAYGDEFNEYIDNCRQKAVAKLINDGFQGEFPNFTKADKQIMIVEEFPYTIKELEYEGFEYDIHFLETKRLTKE